MKKNLLFLVSVIWCVYAGAQSPQVIPWQAVARDATGNLVVNQTICIEFTIHELTATGTIEYQETQTTTTNKLGLFNLAVGASTANVIVGTMAAVNWTGGVKFMEVGYDPTGTCSGFTSMGASQMMSVPYALYAGSAASSAALGGPSTQDYIPHWTTTSGTTGTLSSNGTIYDNGANVGVNNPTPDASAILDIASSTQGVLFPRMGTRPANPALGLIIYNTSTGCLEFFSGAPGQTPAWQDIACPCGTVPGAPVAANFTGSFSNLCTSTPYTYTIEPVSGATSYTWTVTPSGNATVVSGQGTTQAKIQFSSSSATSVNVSASNNCGASAATSQSLAFAPAATVPTWATGFPPTLVCPSNPTSFTFNSIIGNSYACYLTGTGNTINGSSYPGGLTGTNYLPVTASATTTTITVNIANTGTLNIYGYSTTCNTFSATALSTSPTISSGALGAVTLTAPTNVANAIGTVAGALTFTANWSAVANSNAYLLDVSTSSSFSTFVTGFNSLNVGNVTSYSVTGLTCGTTYYYRVRASVGGGCIGAYPTSPAYESATPWVHGIQYFTTVSASNSFTIPCGSPIPTLTFEIWGAGGGGAINGSGGGPGGYVTGTYTPAGAGSLIVVVGGAGAGSSGSVNAVGGGGAGNDADGAGSGGGMSGVFLTASSPIAAAGGGGGSGSLGNGLGNWPYGGYGGGGNGGYGEALTTAGGGGGGQSTPGAGGGGFPYAVGTISQSGTTITGSGTTFSAAFVGSVITFANSATATVTAFVSTTSLTVTPSQTEASQAYSTVAGAGFPGTQASPLTTGISGGAGYGTAAEFGGGGGGGYPYGGGGGGGGKSTNCGGGGGGASYAPAGFTSTNTTTAITNSGTPPFNSATNADYLHVVSTNSISAGTGGSFNSPNSSTQGLVVISW